MMKYRPVPREFNSDAELARDRIGRVHAIRLPNTGITSQGINNDGVVVGTLGQGDKYYGFIWTP